MYLLRLSMYFAALEVFPTSGVNRGVLAGAVVYAAAAIAANKDS